MSDIPIHASELPECKILADLESIANDLRVVVEITERLIGGEKDLTLVRAFFSAGLITYRRCFTSGIRNGLTREDISRFAGKALEMHDYLYAQANRLIAHSVILLNIHKLAHLFGTTKSLGWLHLVHSSCCLVPLI